MISLNYRDNSPIYEQVKNSLRRLIISRAIPPGDRLPSVRQLAAQLAINPNTIQKAYDALEQEGYAQRVTGKGSFAALPDDVSRERQQQLLAQLDTIVAELLDLGMCPQDIARRCTAGSKEEPT